MSYCNKTIRLPNKQLKLNVLIERMNNLEEVRTKYNHCILKLIFNLKNDVLICVHDKHIQNPNDHLQKV